MHSSMPVDYAYDPTAVGDWFLMVDIVNDLEEQLLKSMRIKNYRADPSLCDGIRLHDQLLCIEYFTDKYFILAQTRILMHTFYSSQT